MKTLSLFSTVSFLLLFLLSGCTEDKNTPTPIEGKPVHLSARVAGQTTSFAFDLLQKIDASEPAGENIFVSPLSLHIALGMLVNGAEEETKAAILKAMKSDNGSVEDLNNAYKTLLKELPNADEKVKLAIANSMWSRAGFPIKNSFKDVLNSVFDSEIYDEPFNTSTVGKINQWASDNTEGKIDNVIESISDDLVMFLMNALYFKGDWKYAFQKSQTQDWNFRLDSGNEKQVKMMFVESDLRAYQSADFTAVELPYSSGQFNLTFFLPASGKTLTETIQKFDHTQWETVQNGLNKADTKVGFPKFSMDYEIQLKNVLSQMGMGRAFGGDAQFSGISEAAKLSVDFVKQNTFLNIDEEGTEAAAVTTIGVGLTSVGPSGPRTYIADQPFFFVISENTSNTVLFTGRVVNP